MTDKTQEPVAWINWCAATGKRSVSFECESELASQPLYEGITQNTQDHYSNFHSWFYSSPHRAKYSTDHPAYLAAQEAWEASSDLKKYNYTNGYCTGRTDLLAEQKSQQPVAWMYDVARYGPTDLRGQQWRPAISRTKPNMHDSLVRDMTPLYTSPQPAQQQEPVAWMFQHDETGRTMCVDVQQVEWGFEKGNPRLKKIAPLYTSPQPAQQQEPDCVQAERDRLARECARLPFGDTAASFAVWIAQGGGQTL